MFVVANDGLLVKSIDNGTGFAMAQGISNAGKARGNQIGQAESIGAEMG